MTLPSIPPILHLSLLLIRIPGSMNAAAHYCVNLMDSEASAIVRGLRRRDPDLLDRLIEQYQHRLLRYLVYLSGNRELAEDLFQETWIRVLERGHQYDGKHEFSTWLYAVARNLTIDYLRKKSPVSLDGLAENEEHVPFEPADPSPPAWQVVQHQEQAERVSAALLSIPAEYRDTVVLRFQEGLSLTEIATVTSAPLGTVKSRLYRALNLLVSLLEGERK
jgi:RNA polymerase sigma-70 factor (ECF subfamily)